MVEQSREQPHKCAGHCTHCAMDVPGDIETPLPSGIRLAAAAVGVFLVPILMAVLAAVWMRNASALAQTGAAVAGLLSGILLAGAMALIVRNKAKK